MSYQSKYQAFRIKPFEFDNESHRATFRFQFDDSDYVFTETIDFNEAVTDYDQAALMRALSLAAVLVGTTYYKCFPTQRVIVEGHSLDAWQASFFNSVYQEGLSQFAFENQLTRTGLATFKASDTSQKSEMNVYASFDEAPLVLQSGGKDSLLLAHLLELAARPYTPWFIQNSSQHPKVLDSLRFPLNLAKRQIDTVGLEKAAGNGALNGHVPVTYIVLSLAIAQAILLGKNQVIAAIGNEGEEPHAQIGDLAVSHQWSKTWAAEQQLRQYATQHIVAEFSIGSALRRYSELKIAELFVKNCWQKYKYEFSSCNRANYMQGANNQQLQWCGNCPKCANSFLLFMPFVKPAELIAVFGGENLLKKASLEATFKGLLGIEGFMKPFECVGETGELRLAYHMAQPYDADEYTLPFVVPASTFDYEKVYPHQADLAIV